MSLNKIDQDIENLLKQLPESLKLQVLQYTEYLVSKYDNQNYLADNSLSTNNFNEAKQNKENMVMAVQRVKSKYLMILMSHQKSLRSICNESS